MSPSPPLSWRLHLPLALSYALAGGCAWALGLGPTAHSQVVGIPLGLALAAALLGGPGIWWGVAIGGAAVALATGASIAYALGLAAIDMGMVALGSWLLRRGGLQPEFTRLRDYLLLLAVVAFLLQPASLTQGCLVLGGSPHPAAGLRLWSAGALASLLAVPLALTWATRSRQGSRRSRWWMTRLLASLALAGVALIGFQAGDLPALHLPALALVCAAFLIVLAMTAGWGMAFGLGQAALLAGIAILATARGCGPFAGAAPQDAPPLDLFLSALVVATGIVGTLARGRAHLADELQASEERFRAIIDASAEGIGVTDLEGRHVFVNHTFCTMFGYTPEEFRDIHILDLTHAEDRLATTAYRRRLQDGNSAVERQDRHYVRKGGSEFWGRATVTALRNRQGAITGFVGVVSDVTESRQLEDAVRQSEERLRLATRAARIGVVDWDLGLNQGRLDRVFDELHGTALSQSSRILDDWLALMPVNDRLAIRGAIETALGNSPEYSGRYRIQHPRFGERHLQIQGTVYRDPEGKPLRMVGVVWDVTERIAAEQALEEALASADRERRQAQHFLNVAGVMMVALDLRGRITLINASGCALLGWKAEELEGRDWFDTCMVGEKRDELRGVFTRLVAQGSAAGEVGAFESEVLTRSGERRVCAFRNVVLHDDEGHAVGTLSSAMDITELRRLNESLAQARDAAEAASRAKADFLAMMSHEIRTPLNGVLGLAGMLLDTPLDATQRELTGTLRTCGDSLLVLINDILDFSKIEAGRLDLEEEDFDLYRTIDDAVALVAEPVIGKDLELGIVVGPDVPIHLRGDQTRLRQVFANLLANAVKFTAQGGITVRVSRLSTEDRDSIRLVVSVADTGIGISLEAQSRLFQVFSQAERSTTRRFGGTGLGLAICRLLVERMGGRITVNSTPHAGSTFRFDVRLHRSTAASDAETIPGVEGRVLITLRRPILRTTLLEQLTAWRLQAAAIAPEELSAALATPPGAHLLIVDDDDAATLDLAVAHGLPAIRLCSQIQARGEHALPRPLRLSALRRALTTACGGTPPTSEVVAAARPLRGHLLVAEDNPVNQRVILAQLARLGLTADLVADGHEALAAVVRRSYDLVLMDCQMPECDGLEATAAIRRRETGPTRMPIIALTAGVTAEERATCLAAGMDEMLGKPVRREALAQILGRWLRPAVMADALPLADPAALHRLRDDAGDIEDYRTLFHTEAGRQISALLALLGQGDLPGVAATAHRLKSSATLLGARRLTARLLSIEQAARTGGIDECRSFATGLDDLAAQTLAAIDEAARQA